MVVVKNSGGLVLTRRVGETIVVRPPHGPAVAIAVRRVSRGRVRLQVLAPLDHAIARGERLGPDEAAA